MTSECRKRLIYKSSDGTKLHKNIAKILLDERPFNNLEEMASITKTSTSSASRFVQDIGYNSFKFFLHEYHLETEDDVVQKFIHDQIETMKKHIKNEIHIISSKYDRSIALFLKLRLDMHKLENTMFDDQRNIKVRDYLLSIKSGTLLLFDIQGDSNLISNTIAEIATIKNRNFNVVIFSTNSWTKAFRKYSFIKIIFLKKQIKYGQWLTLKEYNKLSINIIWILLEWLNTIDVNHLLSNDWKNIG